MLFPLKTFTVADPPGKARSSSYLFFFLLFVHIFNISRTKNTHMIFPESSEMLLSLQTTEDILKAQKFFADIGSRLLISQNQHLLTVGGGSC